MRPTKVCPVVEVIKEIRGGNPQVDEDSPPENIIKLGGSEDSVELVCDNVSFYIMLRKMELARFKLSNPSVAECEVKAAQMFREYDGLDYTALYSRIIDKALKKRYLYNQFTQLVELVERLNQLILTRIMAASKKGESINISLADIYLLPHIDQLITYRPDILCTAVNQLIRYVNKLNINAIIRSPMQVNIAGLSKCDAHVPAMGTLMPHRPHGKSAEQYLEYMTETLGHELVVAEYVREIEKYQCAAINKLNEVYDFCKKIINMLTEI